MMFLRFDVTWSWSWKVINYPTSERVIASSNWHAIEEDRVPPLRARMHLTPPRHPTPPRHNRCLEIWCEYEIFKSLSTACNQPCGGFPMVHTVGGMFAPKPTWPRPSTHLYRIPLLFPPHVAVIVEFIAVTMLQTERFPQPDISRLGLTGWLEITWAHISSITIFDES